MADDLDDAEAVARNHTNLENDEIGFILARLIRQIRLLRVIVKNLDDRLKVLEP